MIFAEKGARGLPLFELIAKERDIQIIDDISQVEDVKTNIILTSERDNFVHPCPGTNIYRCCNYHVADIMQGCPFDCAYCILQAYLPHKYIKVCADTDVFLSSICEAVRLQPRRLGTGELSDSLALDNIVPLSKYLVPLANSNDNLRLELKTKSANIDNLLNMNPKNVTISWSLNPSNIIEKEEPLTARLDKRLNAARACAEHGYKVAFHFDPLIYHENFENLYGELIDKLHDTIEAKSVDFISVSTFRCPKELMHVMRLRKDVSSIPKGDFIRGLDGKVRYFKSLRVKMMSFVIERLRAERKDVFIYMCMEHESVWRKLLGFDPGEREEFEKLFL